MNKIILWGLCTIWGLVLLATWLLFFETGEMEYLFTGTLFLGFTGYVILGKYPKLRKLMLLGTYITCVYSLVASSSLLLWSYESIVSLFKIAVFSLVAYKVMGWIDRFRTRYKETAQFGAFGVSHSRRRHHRNTDTDPTYSYMQGNIYTDD